jgi:hypothetical protein
MRRAQPRCAARPQKREREGVFRRNLANAHDAGSPQPCDGRVAAIGELTERPAGGNNYPENGHVKPPRRDTRALSPTGVLGGKTPLRLAAEKRRPHSPLAPMRSAPAYFLCKWGV